MIAKLTVSLLVLTAFAALAPTASADPFGAGDCQKSGLCAGGCVDLRTDCGGNIACVGISYQVPQCVSSPDEVSTGGDVGLRCLGLPCDIINAVCYVATHHACVG
jgi:hypothetical protein